MRKIILFVICNIFPLCCLSISPYFVRKSLRPIRQLKMFKSSYADDPMETSASFMAPIMAMPVMAAPQVSMMQSMSTGGYGGAIAPIGFGGHSMQMSTGIQTMNPAFLIGSTYSPMMSHQSTNVLFNAPMNPINMLFHGMTPINIQHQAVQVTNPVQHTFATHAPQTLVHTVTRPVIYELNEIIAPVRKVKQAILPVREEIHTVSVTPPPKVLVEVWRDYHLNPLGGHLHSHTYIHYGCAYTASK